MRREKTLLQRVGLFLFTIILVFLIIFITLNRDDFNFDAFRRWLTYGDVELSETGESESFAHAGGDYASFTIADQGIVMVSQVGTRYYGFSGDIIEEQVIRFTNPIMHTGDENSVLYDAGGKILVVYGKQDEKFTLATGSDGTVVSARMNANDWLAVVTQETGYRGVVTVYNKQYQPVMDISLSTTYVMHAQVSPDNNRLALITVGQTQGLFESTLLIYDIGNEEVVKTVKFSGNVVLDMDYEEDTLWILCEKQLIMVDMKEFSYKTWSFSEQYLKGSSLGGDGFATLLLGQYRAGTANRLVVINATGEIIGEKQLTATPLSLASAGKYIAYLTGDEFTIFTSNLTEYAVLEQVRHAVEVGISPDGSAVLASKQEAWLFLPN